MKQLEKQEKHQVVERLTREEMTKKYPNTYLGLRNIIYKDNDGVTLESAEVVYTDKTEDELFEMQINGTDGIISWYTNDDTYPLGFATSGIVIIDDDELKKLLRIGDIKAMQSKYVVDYLMKDKGYNVEKAIDIWYNSKTKSILIDGEVDYTHLAPTQIYDELLMELNEDSHWLKGQLD